MSVLGVVERIKEAIDEKPELYISAGWKDLGHCPISIVRFTPICHNNRLSSWFAEEVRSLLFKEHAQICDMLVNCEHTVENIVKDLVDEHVNSQIMVSSHFVFSASA